MHKFMVWLVILTSTVLPGHTVAAADFDPVMLIQGCRACHIIGAGGGTLGPPLKGIGRRLNPQQLHRRLVEPQQLNPETQMPDYSHLPERDIDQLIRALQQLR